MSENFSIYSVQIICDVHAQFEHLLNIFSLAWLDLETFAVAVIHAKGAPLTQCFGLILLMVLQDLFLDL